MVSTQVVSAAVPWTVSEPESDPAPDAWDTGEAEAAQDSGEEPGVDGAGDAACESWLSETAEGVEEGSVEKADFGAKSSGMGGHPKGGEDL